MSQALWISTTNQGKLNEFRNLMGAKVELHSVLELKSYAAPPENGATFVDNARIKAKTLKAMKPGVWVVADDSARRRAPGHDRVGREDRPEVLGRVRAPSMSGVFTIPMSVAEAKEFLSAHERHYVETGVEAICAIGLAEKDGDGVVVRRGAAILGRKGEDGALLHIYVDGTFQGYSVLYGACWRALKALGYTRAYL